ncbi:hypothetical protein F5884DRAFT_377246 [Xylogone sp. PMI_703]|nr:hypothetical protein F5884DRAFT_377246 [Xylogone sp. PMI_703]
MFGSDPKSLSETHHISRSDNTNRCMPPQFLPPRASGPHRIACFALYRALLRQCPRIPLPAELQNSDLRCNPIKHLIRKGFKRNVGDTSHRIVIAALETGYTFEKLLRSAGDGNTESISQIHNLLQQIHNTAETQRVQQKLNPPPPKPRPPLPAPYPGAKKILESRPRPREEFADPERRRPAIFTTTTSGFAFLRFKKPQSEYLSRVLRDKLKQKINRTDAIQRIEEDLEWARAEEIWEDMVRAETGERIGDGGGWSRDLAQARHRIWTLMNARQAKDKEMASKFLEIAEKEKVLYDQERALRKHEKNMRNMARKLERRSQDEIKGN